MMKSKTVDIKRNYLLLMGAGLLVACLLGYGLLAKDKEDLTTIDGIYAAIKKEATSRFNNVELSEGPSSPNGIPVSVSGFEYRISTDAVPSIKFRIEDAGDPDETYKSTEKPLAAVNIADATSAYVAVMERAGFRKIYDGENITPNNLWSIIYVRDEISCTRNDHGAWFMTISCYTDELMLNTAAAARDFVSAYQWYEGNPKIDFSETYIDSFKIITEDRTGSAYYDALTASKTTGYQLAEMSLVSYQDEIHPTHNFYLRTRIGETWQYGGEQAAMCDFYKGDKDRRKAFYDQVCSVDESGRKYRRLDTNNPLSTEEPTGLTPVNLQ